LAEIIAFGLFSSSSFSVAVVAQTATPAVVAATAVAVN
jgi:hypothetical protein